MGFFKSGGSCGECGLDGGEHAWGCPQAGGERFARGNDKWRKARQRAVEGEKDKADEFVRRFKNTRFTTYTPANPGNKRMPPGVKMVKGRDGMYGVVRDENFDWDKGWHNGGDDDW